MEDSSQGQDLVPAGLLMHRRPGTNIFRCACCSTPSHAVEKDCRALLQLHQADGCGLQSSLRSMRADSAASRRTPSSPASPAPQGLFVAFAKQQAICRNGRRALKLAWSSWPGLWQQRKGPEVPLLHRCFRPASHHCHAPHCWMSQRCAPSSVGPCCCWCSSG